MISVNKLILDNSDAKKVFKVIKNNWISSSGPEIIKFEKKFASLIGKKYSSLVTSGTAALEIAVKSLNLKKNDEVIIPNFTIISNALAVFKNDLKIVPIDCDLETWNMDIEQLKKKISHKTKAIIATHIYGYPLEIDKIKMICKQKKFILLKMLLKCLEINIRINFVGHLEILVFLAFTPIKQSRWVRAV